MLPAMARLVFMGSPRFALPTLRSLSRDHEVVGVVTQPDRPAGRGRELKPSAVKVASSEIGIPVITPETLHDAEALGSLAAWQPDVIIVAAFGQILRQNVLDLPPHGCLNVHASLLPRWRGASPIAAAILAGDAKTGVTIMRMDAGLDTGPILAQREDPYLGGGIREQPQPAEGVTIAPQLSKEDGRLDWSAGAAQLDRRVRAVTPWPAAFTFWRTKRLRVLKARPLTRWKGDAAPGRVVETEDGPAVATGAGALLLEEIQLAGKRALPASAFVQGQRDFLGSQLGV
jgi:methionyl-tRNA formyltransferase